MTPDEFNAEAQIHARQGLEAARIQHAEDTSQRQVILQRVNEHAQRIVIAGRIAESEQQDFRRHVQTIVDQHR